MVTATMPGNKQASTSVLSSLATGRCVLVEGSENMDEYNSQVLAWMMGGVRWPRGAPAQGSPEPSLVGAVAADPAAWVSGVGHTRLRPACLAA